MEPPPRATIIRSGAISESCSAKELNPSIARETSLAQLSPCTATGHKTTFLGKRSLKRCKISLITTPDGEVTTPIISGK